MANMKLTRRALLLALAGAPVAAAVAPQAVAPLGPQYISGFDLASEPSVMIRQVWQRVGDQWRCDAFIGYGNIPFDTCLMPQPPFGALRGIRTRFDPARLPA